MLREVTYGGGGSMGAPSLWLEGGIKGLPLSYSSWNTTLVMSLQLNITLQTSSPSKHNYHNSAFFQKSFKLNSFIFHFYNLSWILVWPRHAFISINLFWILHYITLSQPNFAFISLSLFYHLSKSSLLPKHPFIVHLYFLAWVLSF